MATAAITPRASETACSLRFFPAPADPFTASPFPVLDNPQRYRSPTCQTKPKYPYPPRNYDQFRLLSFTFYFMERQAVLAMVPMGGSAVRCIGIALQRPVAKTGNSFPVRQTTNHLVRAARTIAT